MYISKKHYLFMNRTPNISSNSKLIDRASRTSNRFEEKKVIFMACEPEKIHIS